VGDAGSGWAQLRFAAHRPAPGPLEDAAAVPLPGGAAGMLLLGGRRQAGGDPLPALWRLHVDCADAAASAVWSKIQPLGTSPFARVPPHASHALFWVSRPV
jgi:hypothetical protein